jgi:hypothetical protein
MFVSVLFDQLCSDLDWLAGQFRSGFMSQEVVKQHMLPIAQHALLVRWGPELEEDVAKTERDSLQVRLRLGRLSDDYSI